MLLRRRKKNPISIEEVYPWMTKEELVEAEKNLIEYGRIVREIFDHILKKNGGKPPLWLKRQVWEQRKKEDAQKSVTKT